MAVASWARVCAGGGEDTSGAGPQGLTAPVDQLDLDRQPRSCHGPILADPSEHQHAIADGYIGGSSPDGSMAMTRSSGNGSLGSRGDRNT